MPTQKIENPPGSIIGRKPGLAPGESAEKGLITLPGESERVVSVVFCESAHFFPPGKAARVKGKSGRRKVKREEGKVFSFLVPFPSRCLAERAPADVGAILGA